MWKNFLRAISARRGAQYHAPPPFWPCNKVPKPNFQSIVLQSNNDRSLFSLILAKLLLLDIRCENIFALSIVTALTACPFSIKKCAKMSVFCENRKNLLGATLPDPLSLWRLRLRPQTRGCTSLLPNPSRASENFCVCPCLPVFEFRLNVL